MLLFGVLMGVGMPASHAAPSLTNRSSVIAVHNPAATWRFIPSPDVVRDMVDKGLTQFTGRPTPIDAWRTLVASNDVVGIKVLSAPGPVCGTRPAVVEALVTSLLAAGHPAQQIVIWDKRRFDLRGSGWVELASRLGVRCVASADVGWDAGHSYDNALLGRPLFDELEFDRKEAGVGRKSHLTKLLTQDITKIISVAPVLNHNSAGVNGHLLGLGFGSFDNTLRFESGASLIAESVPDLLLHAQPEIVDRLVLCLGDALICQYRGEERTLLHYAVALNELRFSKDPVALDVLALADVENARKSNPTDGEKPAKTELYTNAELAVLGIADLKRIDVTRAP